jgi:hypothetical protein
MIMEYPWRDEESIEWDYPGYDAEDGRIFHGGRLEPAIQDMADENEDALEFENAEEMDGGWD